MRTHTLLALGLTLASRAFADDAAPAPAAEPAAAPHAPAAAPSEGPIAPAPAAATQPVAASAHCDCDDGRKEILSFGISTGLRANMASLGDTIAKDGTVELGSNTALRALGSTKNVFQSGKDDAVLLHNSSSTTRPTSSSITRRTPAR